MNSLSWSSCAARSGAGFKFTLSSIYCLHIKVVVGRWRLRSPARGEAGRDAVEIVAEISRGIAPCPTLTLLMPDGEIIRPMLRCLTDSEQRFSV
jgi:hypothetical protein